MENSPNFSFLSIADRQWLTNFSANKDKNKRLAVAKAFDNPKISTPDIEKNFKTLFRESPKNLDDTIQQFKARSNSAIASCAKLPGATKKLQDVPYLCLSWAHKALLQQDPQDAWVHVDSDSSDEKTNEDLKLKLITSIKVLATPEPEPGPEPAPAPEPEPESESEPEWELVSNTELPPRVSG